MITIILALDHLIHRAIQTIPLLCLVFFRPVHKDKRLERSGILSTKKLIAKGNLSEVKTFLGWTINTRTMRVSLPNIKAIKWIGEIDETLHLKVVNFKKKLEKLTGKLNYTAFIIPFSRYFLNRIRYQMTLAKKFGPQKLSDSTKEDLNLFKDSLSLMSTNGVSITNITSSLLDFFCWSDACNHGMGGYSSTGQAWQWKLPQKYVNVTSINLLEFLASVVTIIITLKNEKKDSRIFAFTNNSSALGWLHKASFHPATQHKHDLVTRKLAKVHGQNQKISIFSEHIKGERNNIADTLSREFTYTKDDLTNYIIHSFPKQVSQNFAIIGVPQELISWILSILEDSVTKKESDSRPHKKRGHTSRSGPTSAREPKSRTDSCQSLTAKKGSTSSAPLQLQSEEIFLEEPRRTHCSSDLLRTQSDMFVRCSGLTDLAILELTSQVGQP